MNSSCNKYFCSFFYNGIKIILISVLTGSLFACSSTRPETIFRNSTLNYEPGFPHVSMSSNGYYNQENKAIITVTTEVVPSSLVTFRDDSVNEGKQTFGFDIYYEIYDRNDKGESISQNNSQNFTYDDNVEPEEAENIVLVRDFEVPSGGVYDVLVTVIDRISNKEKRSEDRIVIPEISTGEFGLSSVKFTAFDSSRTDLGFVAVTTYDVTKDFEEILFESQITNDLSGDSLLVEARVIKFRSDNLPAEKMSAPVFANTTLQRNGIDYSDSEIVYSQTRSISPGDKVFTYKVGLATPEIGNYRYEVRVLNTKNDETLTRAFDFGVKREGFPFVETARHLAESLYYLMDEKNYNRFIAISDEDSLKEAVDDFWLENIQDANKARFAIDLYYSRVEEANKYFSSYKEGWKTDLGMIHILFGPPRYSYNTIDYIHWSYSVDRYASRYNYYFLKERRRSNVFPFVLYLLDRSRAQLKENEYIILDEWLSGNIVN